MYQGAKHNLSVRRLCLLLSYGVMGKYEGTRGIKVAKQNLSVSILRLQQNTEVYYDIIGMKICY